MILNEAGRAALAAAGTSRALGYLKATEWFHTDILGATTPSEMAAAEAKHVCPSSSGPDLNPDLGGWCRDSNGDTWATVYAADGTTVLGKALTGHVEER